MTIKPNKNTNIGATWYKVAGKKSFSIFVGLISWAMNLSKPSLIPDERAEIVL